MLCLSTTKAQTTIELGANFKGHDLAQDEIYWFEDVEQKYSFPEIQSNPKFFSPLNMGSPNFGYKSSTFWLKFNLKENNNQHTDYFLDISYTTLDSVFLYSQTSSGKWQNRLSGDLTPLSQRPIRHRHIVFPLSVHAEGVNTFYLKVRSKGSILVPMEIHDTESLRLSQTKDESFYFFYYGILAVMIFYNFFLFLSLRDYNYLLYSITIFLNMGFQACLLGHTLIIWGNSLWWVNISVTASIFAFLSVLLVFVLNFLEVKKYSVLLFRIVGGISILWAIMLVLSFIIDYGITIRFTVIAAFSTSLLVFFTSLYLWIRGRTSARFFTIAWLVYIIGAITMASRNAAILPDVFLTRQGILIGSIIEVVFISFALADRINIYRSEKEEAQLKNIDLIQNQNQLLEEKVQERTQALEEQQEQVLVQNQELLQIQKELHLQRSAVEEHNEELQFKNTLIQQSIQTANNIQKAILPSEQIFSALFSSFFVLYKPRDIVSGDFYWITQRQSEIWIAVADCTGHGVPGAFMTLLGQSLLDKVVNIYQAVTPAEALQKLDIETHNALRQEETEGYVGMDLAMIKLTFSLENKINIAFSGAKTPLYICHKEENTLKTYKGDRVSIGRNFQHQAGFTNQFIEVEQGSRLYLTTDGFRDQNNRDRKRYGSSQFKKLIQKNSSQSLYEQKNIFETELLQFMEGTDQRDDILFMGIEL